MSVLEQLLGHPPEALLFDLDGTLVDSVPDLAAAVDAMLLDYKLEAAGEEKVRQWVGNGAVKLVQRALAHAKGCDESALSDVTQAHQYFLQHYATCASRHSRLYAGVAEALAHWHSQGIAMAVVTNKPRQFVPELLQSFQIDSYFPVIVGGECLSHRKPHPEPLLHVCQQFNVPVNRCLMIGDSRNDVGAARAANMAIACVSYGYNHGEPIADAQPDLVVDSLLELC